MLHLNMINQLISKIQNADSIGSLSPIIHWRDDDELNLSFINVVTWDREGLFFKLAAAISLSGLTIVSTRAISRKDHISIDTFCVVGSHKNCLKNPEIQQTLRQYVDDILVNGKDFSSEISMLEEQQDLKERSNKNLPSEFPSSVDVYHELS